MFGMSVKTEDTTHNVKEAADTATFRNFGHAAASIRKDAQSTIERSAGPSPAGTPPHTRRGLIKNAITFFADKEGAVIGPRFSRAGTAGEAHEFGGEYKGGNFPARSFMEPALERQAPRFASSFGGSIHE